MRIRESKTFALFPGNRREIAGEARGTVDISSAAVGAEVARVFEGGDKGLPSIIERSLSTKKNTKTQCDPEWTAVAAGQSLELRVGQASPIAHADGQITRRAARAVSETSNANRMRGRSAWVN